MAEVNTMKQCCTRVLACATALAVTACAAVPVAPHVGPAEAAASISPEAIRTDVVALASPEFGGRAPASPGEHATVAYIAERFAAAGVAPGIDGAYVQPLALAEFRADAGGMLAVAGPAGAVPLAPQDDYVLHAGRPAPALAVERSTIVIGGFGIRADEMGWNDYAGLDDLAGKTVVLFRGDPGTATGDPALFGGEALSENGLVGTKAELAAALGAAAVLLVHTEASAGYPWQTLASGGGTGVQYSLPDGRPRLTLFAHLSEGAARRLLANAGHDYDRVLAAAAAPGFSAIETDLVLSGKMSGEVSSIVTRNVVGMIKGAEAPDECVVYTAHWDHMGSKPDADGEDALFNGAVDNATGTAMLIAIAQAYARLTDPPRRSVYFFATAAEERGLLGARHFVEQPPCEIRNIVAALNMDAHFPYSDRWDAMVVPGLGSSELTTALETVAGRYGRVLVDDPNPAAGAFFRSDHYPFIKAGVPGLYAVGAPTAAQVEADPSIQESFAWYMANGYHQAADEVDQPYPWRLGGLTDDARILFELGWQLASSDAWPNFAEGTRWRALRDQMRGD